MKKALGIAIRIASVPAVISCTQTQATPSSPPAPVLAAPVEESRGDAKLSESPKSASKDCQTIIRDALDAEFGKKHVESMSWWPPEGSIVDDPQTIRCCDQIADGPESQALEAYREAKCCHVASRHPKSAAYCTPWGPPMPVGVA